MIIKVNADDFGWSESCTEAILMAFDQGLIDSTTVCVNGEKFYPAIDAVKKTLWKERVGIHFVLTEGRPLTEEIRKDRFFCDQNGNFHGNIQRYSGLNAKRRELIYNELDAQARRFVETGITFHHADSHHHIHTAPFITPIVIQIMKKYGIRKLRIHRNVGKISQTKRLYKNIYNQIMKVQGINYSDFFGGYEDLQNISFKSADQRVLEVMCHPDIDENGHLIDRNNESPLS